ncbi:MAG: thiamine pyrophosphate-dependent enzyme, partial [Rikenellaceae bacterium]
HPKSLVFTYQGDGDLTAIGMGEFMHACNRGDNITVIYVNNGIYGMTGGQMAPTTLEGAKTVTCPEGRRHDLHGYPCKVADMIKLLPGVTYVTRQSVNTAANVKKTKKAIQHAFENSLNHKGLSFVEVVSTCSSGWKLTPVKANEWLAQNMFPFYELGDLKNE